MGKYDGREISEINHEVLACYAEGRLEEGNRIAERLERVEQHMDTEKEERSENGEPGRSGDEI